MVNGLPKPIQQQVMDYLQPNSPISGFPILNVSLSGDNRGVRDSPSIASPQPVAFVHKGRAEELFVKLGIIERQFHSLGISQDHQERLQHVRTVIGASIGEERRVEVESKVQREIRDWEANDGSSGRGVALAAFDRGPIAGQLRLARAPILTPGAKLTVAECTIGATILHPRFGIGEIQETEGNLESGGSIGIHFAFDPAAVVKFIQSRDLGTLRLLNTPAEISAAGTAFEEEFASQSAELHSLAPYLTLEEMIHPGII
jgi:hypothetical protein